jgi:hypothetical protein
VNTGAFIIEQLQANRGGTLDASTIKPIPVSMLWEFASWRRAGGQKRGCKWWEQGHRWAMCSLFAAFASECEHVARTFCQILRTPVLATCPGMQPTALSHANTQRTILTRSWSGCTGMTLTGRPRVLRKPRWSHEPGRLAGESAHDRRGPARPVTCATGVLWDLLQAQQVVHWFADGGSVATGASRALRIPFRQIPSYRRWMYLG